MSAANRSFAFMRNRTLAVGMGALFLAGCNTLDVKNQNAPDSKRALADPAAIEAVAGGTLPSWFNTYDGMEGNEPPPERSAVG